jgi:hypothetical protein
MRRSTIWAVTAAAVGIVAFTHSAAAQTAVSPVDPATQPTDPAATATGRQQEVPTEQAPSDTPGMASERAANQEAAAHTAASPAAERAEHDTRLATVTPSGMTTQGACLGFQSVAACAATMHASHNLDLSFADLKSRVTGGQKLAAAIHSLKPEANARSEARKAEGQARVDLPSAPQG